MLRNLTDYVIIPFLASGMLQNFTNCAAMLPFDFRHVMELHGLPNDGCQVPRLMVETPGKISNQRESKKKERAEGKFPNQRVGESKKKSVVAQSVKFRDMPEIKRKC